MPHSSAIFPLQGTLPVGHYTGEQYTSENVVPQENYPQDLVHGHSGIPHDIQENYPFSLSESNSYRRTSEDPFSPISISIEDAYFPVLRSRIGSDIDILSPEQFRTHGTYSDRSGSSPGISALDELSYSAGQGCATDTFQLPPGYDQSPEQYHLLGSSHAQPLIGQRVDNSINGEFDYLLFGGGPSPTIIPYPGDQEPFGHSPDDANESLNPLSGRTYTSDPETGIRAGHQQDLGIRQMEINTPCSLAYDGPSLPGYTGRSVTKEGHVSPRGDHPRPGGRSPVPRTESAHRAGTRTIDRSHEWYSRQPDSDNNFRCPVPGCEGAYKQFCHYKCIGRKHIDKHLKPHRCRHPECEGSAFASAGGVLRHEREAHGMHAPRRYPCSIEGCDRGKGNPFNRNWNLQDHLRRVHNVQPGQCGQSDQHSQHSPRDQHARPDEHGQNLTADIVFKAGGSSSIGECVREDNNGYSQALSRKGDEEDEEDEPPRFQESPRQNRASWSTAGYPSAGMALLTPAPTAKGSPAQGPSTTGFIEQLNPRWASLEQCYQRVLDSPSDLSALEAFQIECLNMYEITKRMVGHGVGKEEGGYSNSG